MPQDHRNPPKVDFNWRHTWKEWGVLATSTAQRKAIWARDRGLCAGCNQNVGAAFEADHVLALHTIPPSHLEDYPAVLRYWTIENLQTLGISCGCHAAKSAQEATARAKVKRIIKKRSPKIISHPFRQNPKFIGRKSRIKKFKPRPAKHI